MHSDQILVFDIGSEYGHFRKFNTTTSPLTYSIPTRPAMTGLLGAILGIEREVAAGKFRKGVVPLSRLFSKEMAGIGIQLMHPVKKVNVAFNLLDTEKTASSFFNIKQRTQIEYELLKDPFFRVFVSFKDKELFGNLVNYVQNNCTYFTPYLGLSQFTASIQFKGLSIIEPLNSIGFQEVVTAVNLSNANLDDPIQFDRSVEFKYTLDTLPVEMLPDRVVTEYAEVIVETNGRPIKVKSNNIYKTEGFGNILFL